MDRYIVVETKAPGGEKIASVVDTQEQTILAEFLKSEHGDDYRRKAVLDAAGRSA